MGPIDRAYFQKLRIEAERKHERDIEELEREYEEDLRRIDRDEEAEERREMVQQVRDAKEAFYGKEG